MTIQLNSGVSVLRLDRIYSLSKDHWFVIRSVNQMKDGYQVHIIESVKGKIKDFSVSVSDRDMVCHGRTVTFIDYPVERLLNMDVKG